MTREEAAQVARLAIDAALLESGRGKPLPSPRLYSGNIDLVDLVLEVRSAALREAFDVVESQAYAEDVDNRSDDYQQGASDVRGWALIALGNLMSGQPQVIR